MQYLLWLTALCAIPPAAVGWSPQYLVVFGDSLSDNGIHVHKTPDVHGFRRWNTGPVWSDYLGSQLSIPKNRQHNFAYGGALSGMRNYYGFQWSGVLWQVEQCIKSTICLHHRKKTLVALQAGGGNDFLSGQTDPEVVADNLALAVRNLANAGVRHILVLNLLDAGAFPALEGQPGLQSIMTNLTTATNDMIEVNITQLQADYPEVNLILFDAQDAMNSVLGSGTFKNEVFTHHRNTTIPGEIFEYAWFDDYHLTTAVHKALVEKIVKVLRANKFIEIP